MMRMLLAALLLVAAAPAAEPPERIRLQKQWLAALGYFDEAPTMADSAGYRAARREFADDVGGSADPARFHQQLKAAFERNQRARGQCRGSAARATACLARPQR